MITCHTPVAHIIASTPGVEFGGARPPALVHGRTQQGLVESLPQRHVGGHPGDPELPRPPLLVRQRRDDEDQAPLSLARRHGPGGMDRREEPVRPQGRRRADLGKNILIIIIVIIIVVVVIINKYLSLDGSAHRRKLQSYWAIVVLLSLVSSAGIL